MNSHENIIETIELDPTSDRYRKCPYDGVEFMARHRSSKFCSGHCADEFHNRLKRERKLLPTQAISDAAIIESQIEEIAAIEPETPVDPLTKNVSVLDSIEIDPLNGTNIEGQFLVDKGLNFGAFSSRGMLHNINPDLNCHFVEIGEYRLYWVEPTIFLIAKNKTK